MQRIWKIDLGSSPFLKAKGNIPWINYYGIDLKETKNLKKDLYFKGAVWAKNVCLDGLNTTNWQFDNEFSKGLLSRYDKSTVNYGVPFYRGRGIKVWDTLRDFSVSK